MHAFQTAASAFCIACICAEITTLLAGAGWAGRCIKAVAGLYILVILFRLAPQMKLELKSAAAAAPAAVSIQSTETSLLQGAQERLEADLCAECERRFGTKVKLEITLTLHRVPQKWCHGPVHRRKGPHSVCPAARRQL